MVLVSCVTATELRDSISYMATEVYMQYKDLI